MFVLLAFQVFDALKNKRLLVSIKPVFRLWLLVVETVICLDYLSIEGLHTNVELIQKL